MNKLTTLLVTPFLIGTVVGLGSSLALAAPAQAATGVTIAKVADRSVTPGASTTVKPKVKATGSAKIRSTTVVVSLDGRTVASGKGSATLKGATAPDTYSVSTKVAYTVKGKARTAKRTQALTVGVTAPECATRAAVESLTDGTRPGTGDTLASVVARLGQPVGGSDVTLADYADLGGDEARAEAERYYAAGFSGDTVHRFRMFTMCDDQRGAGFVTFLQAPGGEPRVVAHFVEEFSR